MSKKTSYVLGILLTIIIGTILYWFFCCRPCLEAKNATMESDTIETALPEIKEATTNAFSAIDLKSSLKFNANGNFNFKGSSFAIHEPVSDGLKNEIDRLSNYLKDNKDKTVAITGHFTAAENNTSAFPNLGLARANAVKNYFVLHGMSSKALNTFGKLDDAIVPDASNVFYGPLSFSINTTDANDTSATDALKTLGEAIKADPLVLYFETASASINLTAAQRDKVAKIVRYIDKADNALIKTIGHTDNIGNRATNVRLGMDRAEFAKNYLVRNGISPNKIKVSSKGPDEPIADNSTDEGQAKNRRVVVTIN